MTRFRDWRFRTKIISVLVLLTTGLVVVGALSFTTLSKVAIGSPAYRDIVDSKDLLADVLPPPAYLVEYQLEAHELASNAEADIGSFERRFAELEAAYETRMSFWEEHSTDDALLAALAVADAPVAEYFRTAKTALLPAARAGDTAGATAIVVGPMNDLYEAHREGIDQVVAEATRLFEGADTSATALVDGRRAMLGVALAIAILVALLSIPLLIRSTTVPVSAMSRMARALSSGDLAHRESSIEAADDVSTVANDLQHAMSQMRAEMMQIEGHATSLAVTAEGLAAAARTMASDDGGGAVGRVATAVGELTTAITELSSATQQVNSTASTAVELTARATDGIEALGRSSDAIADVVRLISDVADQTNLLALNASIEASRAGVSGKGFAVVASEVKELARQTATATSDIRERIHQIQREVDDAIGTIASVSQVVADISIAQGTIAAAIEEQTAVVAGIAYEAHEAASAAAQTGDAAADVATRSVDIRMLLDRFSLN